ncbi:MAG: DUF3575 domain-containing protein [Elusimicrobiota bacterium]|nr:DUF3575 domain-containing protein [Elusimicrobiota bacterium]
MKKMIIFCMCVGIFGGALSGFAQEKQERNVIYVNIIPILVSHLNVHYEVAVSNKVSLLAGVGYMSGLYGITLKDYEITTTFIKVGLGFYPAGNPLRGFYLLPNIIPSDLNLKYKPTSETGSATWTTISVELGHRWIWKGGIMFDLSVGAGTIPEVEVTTGNRTETLSGRTGLTHIGVQFGYAW